MIYDYFSQRYAAIADVPGAVVECGLGLGVSFVMLGHLVGKEGKGRTLYGCDSFEGWPQPSETDSQSPRKPKRGEWAVPEEHFLERLKHSMLQEKYPELKIELVRGFYDQSLPDFPDEPIAFLHADCDLEPSYKAVLENLWPKVSVGGVVLFDEYLEFPQREEYGFGTISKWPGAYKAISEFFAGRPEKVQHDPLVDKYFVVKQQ
ncbi:MAG: TylF/MycF/NovP-related O-methyltransferase [Candidatus Andersenbacteria bacterium]